MRERRLSDKIRALLLARREGRFKYKLLSQESDRSFLAIKPGTSFTIYKFKVETGLDLLETYFTEGDQPYSIEIPERKKCKLRLFYILEEDVDGVKKTTEFPVASFLENNIIKVYDEQFNPEEPILPMMCKEEL